MKRRALIAALGGTAATGMTGCVGSAIPDDSDDGDADGSDLDPDDDLDGIQSVSASTRDTSCAGEDDDHVSATKTDSTIRLKGTLPASDPCHEAVVNETELVDETLQVVVDVDVVDADGPCAQCLGQVSYLVDVDVADGAAVSSVVVDHATGERHEVTPRSVADPHPVEMVRLETTDVDCGGGDDSDTASADRVNGRIHVEGARPAPNPCHVARLSGFSRDADTVTLRIGVRSTNDDGDPCVECIGHLAYGTAIALPDLEDIETVIVDHVARDHHEVEL